MVNEILGKKIKEYKNIVSDNKKALKDILFTEIPEMVYNSNAIENSTLTLKDTENIIIKNIIKKDTEIREVFEATNLAKITEQLYESQHKKLSVELILSWHKILLNNINDNIAGRFRTGNEWIKVGTHLGANPKFTNELIYKLVDDYNKKNKGYFLDRIAHFHAEFELIHPFNDGNGRIGRIIANYQLMRAGLPPIIIQNKGKVTDYYPLFNKYEMSGDYSGFIRLFTLLLLESLNKKITQFTAKKIIIVNLWANENNFPVNSALNWAKRQTIPAFRKGGKWFIDANFKK